MGKGIKNTSLSRAKHTYRNLVIKELWIGLSRGRYPEGLSKSRKSRLYMLRQVEVTGSHCRFLTRKVMFYQKMLHVEVAEEIT